MIAMNEIRAFARRIAAEFKPRRIILFGSYAYGTPTEDSDVDLLVIMPYRGRASDMSITICTRIEFPHALDLLVRGPEEVLERYRLNDWFIRDIVDKGKVLHEFVDKRVGRKGRERSSLGRGRVSRAKGPRL